MTGWLIASANRSLYEASEVSALVICAKSIINAAQRAVIKSPECLNNPIMERAVRRAKCHLV